MEPFRVVLNPWNRKHVVITSVPEKGKVAQIWKRNELIHQFTREELSELLSRDLASRIFYHLNEEGSDCIGSYNRTQTHEVNYMQWRDKPFITLVRNNVSEDCRGFPVFDEIVFGITSWSALMESASQILHALKEGRETEHACAAATTTTTAPSVTGEEGGVTSGGRVDPPMQDQGPGRGSPSPSAQGRAGPSEN